MNLPTPLKKIYRSHQSRSQKKIYDVNKKFQDKWPTKLLWVDLFITENTSLHIVKSVRFVSKVKGKDTLLTLKWDFLCKHACHKKIRIQGYGV